MNRTVRMLVVSTIVAAGTVLAVSGPAFADGKTIQNLKDDGYSCEHAATNMTTCTKTGQKDQTCSESEDKCAVLLVKGRHLFTINAPLTATRY